jgi:hypothetical protein
MCVHVYQCVKSVCICVRVVWRQQINYRIEFSFSAIFSLNHFTIPHFTSLTILSSLSPHITRLLFSLFARAWREARSFDHKGDCELHQTRLRSMVCTAVLCCAISHFSLFSPPSSLISLHSSLFSPLSLLLPLVSTLLSPHSSVLTHQFSLISSHSSVLTHYFSLISSHSSVLTHQFSLISSDSLLLTHQFSLITSHSSVLTHQF